MQYTSHLAGVFLVAALVAYAARPAIGSDHDVMARLNESRKWCSKQAAINRDKLKYDPHSFVLRYEANVYHWLIPALNASTPLTLRKPMLIAGVVAPKDAGSHDIVLQVMWIEAVPDADGIRIRSVTTGKSITYRMPESEVQKRRELMPLGGVVYGCTVQWKSTDSPARFLSPATAQTDKRVVLLKRGDVCSNEIPLFLPDDDSKSSQNKPPQSGPASTEPNRGSH